MIDAMMIVFIVLVALVLIVSNIYILFYYGAEEEANNFPTNFSRFVAVLGMILAWSQVLMLPLDVSNSRGGGGGIDMKSFWYLIYMLSAIWIFIVIPFMKNYLEADEDWGCVNKLFRLFQLNYFN